MMRWLGRWAAGSAGDCSHLASDVRSGLDGIQVAWLASLDSDCEPVLGDSLEERASGVRLCGDHERALRRRAVSTGWAGSLLECQAEQKSMGKAWNAGVLNRICESRQALRIGKIGRILPA